MYFVWDDRNKAHIGTHDVEPYEAEDVVEAPGRLTRAWEMNVAELAAATKEYDCPVPLSKTKPLTRQQKAQWERMRRRPHRSIFVRRGSAGEFVHLDSEVLERCLRYAADQGLTLSEVINRGLQGMLAIVDPPVPVSRKRRKQKAAG